MKALLITVLTAGVLGVGLLATTANAQQLRFGFGGGYGDGCGYYNDCFDNGYGYNGNGDGYYGNGYDDGYGHWHYRHHRHHQHCYMTKTWHNHHAVWIKQCRR